MQGRPLKAVSLGIPAAPVQGRPRGEVASCGQLCACPPAAPGGRRAHGCASPGERAHLSVPPGYGPVRRGDGHRMRPQAAWPWGAERVREPGFPLSQ